MNRAFAVFLCCAVVLHTTGIQGIQTSGRGRCICPPVDSNFVPSEPLRKVEIYSVSTSCDRVEIVVTVKSGIQHCLNPASKHVKARLAMIAQNRSLKIAGRRGPAASGRNSPQ